MGRIEHKWLLNFSYLRDCRPGSKNWDTSPRNKQQLEQGYSEHGEMIGRLGPLLSWWSRCGFEEVHFSLEDVVVQNQVVVYCTHCADKTETVATKSFFRATRNHGLTNVITNSLPPIYSINTVVWKKKKKKKKSHPPPPNPLAAESICIPTPHPSAAESICLPTITILD